MKPAFLISSPASLQDGGRSNLACVRSEIRLSRCAEKPSHAMTWCRTKCAYIFRQYCPPTLSMALVSCLRVQ